MPQPITFTFTLPSELADKLKEALEADHITLERIALGWLFFGRGSVEGGAPRLDAMEAAIRQAARQYNFGVNEDSIRRASEAVRRASEG
jgi:hypothetical protein